MKTDFFDLQRHLSDLNFHKLLHNFSHKLEDSFSHTISLVGDDTPDWSQCDITIGESLAVAKLKAPKEQISVLRQLIELELKNKIALTRAELTNTKKEILAQDLSALLYLSENELMPLEDLLVRLMQLLRCHVLVENVSVFGIYDGFTLEGLAGISKDSQGTQSNSSWKIHASSVAGIAAATRNPYLCEDPQNDINFRAIPSGATPKNLVCNPIIHGSTLLGVLNVSNKVMGQFDQDDLAVIARFANIASHVLQKYVLKLRMENFAKSSDNLGKYLSTKVVKNVKMLDSVEIGGIEKRVVCLFIDIRSFTSITEGIQPTVLLELLNFYFDRLTAVIEQHEGTVDKIVGDLIMAVWNMPDDQPNSEFLAVKCAIEMQKEIKRVIEPKWLASGVKSFGGGIGINSGTAIVGNLGSSRFMNYTVIGDAINTAQRLEAQASAGEIWVAEAIFPYIDGKVEKPQRFERGIKLKGKENTVNAYVFRPLQA